jgi:urocanate hydratase
MHAGMVIVANGTPERDERLKRVLTADPGIGVARHCIAGYRTAREMVEKMEDLKVPEKMYPHR